MIKSLTIPRINVASPFAAPVQWSDNCQVAINARTGLVILEPKLPRVSQETLATKGTLLLKGLFKVSHELDIEQLKEAVDVYRRNKVSLSMEVDELNNDYSKPVNDGQLNQKFAFVELLVVEHKWSPVDPVTRRCCLAVLYNTNDLIVFRDDMTILLMFENVKTFAFVTYNMISYVRGSGSLVFWSNSNDNEAAVTYDLGNEDGLDTGILGDIVGLAWNRDSTSLAITTSLNGVWIVEFNESMELEETARQIVVNSRFGISFVKWLIFAGTEYLAIAQTGKLSILPPLNEHILSVSLSNYEMVVGIYFELKGSITTISVAFDNGMVECFEYTKRQLVSTHSDKGNAMAKLVSKSLYKHQLLSQLDTNNVGKGDTVEGQFFNLATSVEFGGLLSVAYKIVPKDVINYTITSKDYMELALVRLSPLQRHIPSTTSISHLTRLWLDECSSFPRFPNEVEELKSFVDEISKIKLASLGEINIADLSADGLENLRQHYNFNYSLLSSMQKWQREPAITTWLADLNNESTAILSAIRKWLHEHIVEIGSSINLLDVLDQFIMQSASPSKDHPVTISMGNKFFTESFTATSASSDTIKLGSGHMWPRCQLTLLPIMEMESQTDELELFSYSALETISSRSIVVRELVSEIQYCIFTGNRLQLQGK